MKIDPVFVVVLVVGTILVLGGVIATLAAEPGSQSRFNAGGVTLLLLVVLGFATWPWNLNYHVYRHVTGTVAAIKPRLLGGTDHTSESYAVRLTSGGTYRCDDTRCSLLSKGDRVTLWCIKSWQWVGTSGYVCNFGDSTSAGAR